MNGQWYIGDDLCSSKKQAEQSAASKALEAIAHNDVKSISAQLSTAHITSDDLDQPPPYSEVVKSTAIEHLPSEYADIERYISIVVECFRGRVRKIWVPDEDGLYKFEIAGSYRYCDNVQKHHRKNQIYFMVDPMKKTYYQMCHDPACFGFRSVTRNITIKQQAPVNEKENNSIEQCSTLTQNVKL